MHKSRKIFLTDKEPRCVLAAYENYDDAPTKEFKTYDQSLQPGDYVIVPTDSRHNMTVIKVIEVGVEADLESTAPMDWIIGTVNTAEHETIKAREDEFLSIINAEAKRRKKEEMKETFLAGVGEVAVAALEDQSAN